jgi:hypothetical protein
MKWRRAKPHEERRKHQVEVNLLDENEGAPARSVLVRARRGCALPFIGVGLLGVTLEALRAGLG